MFVNVDWTRLSQDELGVFNNGDTNVEYACLLTDAYLETIKKSYEVEILGMNVVISKVELVSSEQTKTSVIWKGSCSFGTGWQTGITIEAEKFANASESDVIELIYTTDETTEYWQFKTHFAGTETLLAGNKADLNEWGCANVAKATTSYKITLTKDDVAGLKEKGLYVFGNGINVTKANLIQPVSTGVSHAVGAEGSGQRRIQRLWHQARCRRVCEERGKIHQVSRAQTNCFSRSASPLVSRMPERKTLS